jgi:hypothetical protein
LAPDFGIKFSELKPGVSVKSKIMILPAAANYSYSSWFRFLRTKLRVKKFLITKFLITFCFACSLFAERGRLFLVDFSRVPAAEMIFDIESKNARSRKNENSTTTKYTKTTLVNYHFY